MVSIDVLPTIGLVRCRSCRPVIAIVIIMYHSSRTDRYIPMNCTAVSTHSGVKCAKTRSIIK